VKKRYICPVCGFDELEELPYRDNKDPSYEICPCCGFEFGLDEGVEDDRYKSFRQKWIESGANWFIANRRPKEWNLNKQLKNIERA